MLISRRCRVRRQPDQRKPQQRRRRQIEPLHPVRRNDLQSSMPLLRLAKPRQIDQPPRRSPPATTPAPDAPSRSCRNPARRLACRSTTACTDSPQHRSVERALEARARAAPCRRPARRAHTAHGTAAPPAAATAAGCPRSSHTGRSSPSISPWLSATSARSLGAAPAPAAAWHAAPAPKRRKPALAKLAAPNSRRAAPTHSSCWRQAADRPHRPRSARRSRPHAKAASPDRRRQAAPLPLPKPQTSRCRPHRQSGPDS